MRLLRYAMSTCFENSCLRHPAIQFSSPATMIACRSLQNCSFSGFSARRLFFSTSARPRLLAATSKCDQKPRATQQRPMASAADGGATAGRCVQRAAEASARL